MLKSLVSDSGVSGRRGVRRTVGITVIVVVCAVIAAGCVPAVTPVPPAGFAPVVGRTVNAPALLSGVTVSADFDAPVGEITVHVSGTSADPVCPNISVQDATGAVVGELSGCGSYEFVSTVASRFRLVLSAPSVNVAASKVTLSTPVQVGTIDFDTAAVAAPVLLPGQQARWAALVNTGDRVSASAWSVDSRRTNVAVLEPSGGAIAVSSPATAGRAAVVDIGASGLYTVAVTNEGSTTTTASTIFTRLSRVTDQGVLASPSSVVPALQPGEVARWTTPGAATNPQVFQINAPAGVCTTLSVLAAGLSEPVEQTGCGPISVDVNNAGPFDVRVLNTASTTTTGTVTVTNTQAPTVGPLTVGATLSSIVVPAGSRTVVPLNVTIGQQVRVETTGACVGIEIPGLEAFPGGSAEACEEDIFGSRLGSTAAVEFVMSNTTPNVVLIGDAATTQIKTLSAVTLTDLTSVAVTPTGLNIDAVPVGSRGVVRLNETADFAATAVGVQVAAGRPCVRVDVLHQDGTIAGLNAACPETPLATVVVGEGATLLRLWSTGPITAGSVTVTGVTQTFTDTTPAAPSGVAPINGQASLSGPNESAVTQPCKKYLVVGLRGSSETDGFGTTVQTAVAEMETQLGADNIARIAIERPDYPSASVPIPSAATIAALLFTPTAPAAIANYLSKFRPYIQSLADGSDALYQVLQRRTVQCNEVVLLAGYSQGAMAVHRTLLDLQANDQTTVLNRVAGAVLIADGDRRKDDNMNTYGSAGLQFQGITHTYNLGSARSARFGRSMRTKIFSVCNTLDIVCDHKAPTSFVSGGKTHTGSYKDSQILRNAAKEAATRAKLRSYNTTTTGTGQNNWPKNPLTGATQISAGYTHTCALVAGGQAKCWGNNDSGQLGNGTNTNSNVPVDVVGITGATQITAGLYHTCALVAGGEIKCWGWNYSGQLGNGTFTKTESNVPVDVSGISGATQITGGYSHTCALVAGGQIKCWGYNNFGVLGNGTYPGSKVPVDVVGITGATQITAGSYHTCALVAGGQAKCWGWNYYGQLGNGTFTNSSVPVDVVGITGATQISAGYYHTCALVAGGQIKCWGRNGIRQLGNGTNTNSNVPVTVLAG